MLLQKFVLFLFIGFLIGVFLASLGVKFYLLFLISFLIFLFLRLVFNFKYKYIFILFLILFFGYFYFYFRIFLENKNLNLIYDKNIKFYGKIISDVSQKEKFKEFDLKVYPPFRGKVKVLASNLFDYKYGDVLEINGEIKKQRNINEKPTVFYPEMKIISYSPDSKIFNFLLKIKNYFLSQFKKYLPYDEGALMSGILLGERAEFSESLKQAMNNSGTTHIVALSGYNVGILVLVVSRIIAYLFGRRKVFLISLFVVLGFVLMTGAEASVLRAGIMALILLLGEHIGRIYSLPHSLLFSAVLMVLISPKILFFDLGFQLSFLSLLGVVYLKPAFDNVFNFNPQNQGFLLWRDNLTTTLGAQFAVIPLLILNFGQAPILSFLANIFILTFIPLTMFLGFVLGIFGFWYPLGFLFGLVSLFILKYEISVMKFFSKFSFLNFGGFSWFVLILIYIVLFLWFYHKKAFKLNV